MHTWLLMNVRVNIYNVISEICVYKQFFFLLVAQPYLPFYFREQLIRTGSRRNRYFDDSLVSLFNHIYQALRSGRIWQKVNF